VPFFHNDGWEEGSFVAKPKGHKVAGKESFGLDIYSFDKYVVFAPTTAPLSTIQAGVEDVSRWQDWDPSVVEEKVDQLEKTIRAFGGSAADAPIFVAELQGGWFNQYKHHCTYDDIYTYYGEDYTRLIFDCMLSQGISMLSYYMFFGGTNWGTLGDPDVYTSYDYSACIREWGFLSGRARKLRLGIMFTRSFADVLTRTDFVQHSETLKVTPSNAFNRRRVSAGKNKVEFNFFRNFSRDKLPSVAVQVKYNNNWIDLKCEIPYKRSMITLGNYTTTTNIHLVMATCPIHVRSIVSVNGTNTEVWYIESDDLVSGEFLFSTPVILNETKSNLNPSIRKVSNGSGTVLSFGGSNGWCSVSAGLKNPALLMVAISNDDIYTLTATFEESYWGTGSARRVSHLPASVGWGSFDIQHELLENVVRIESRPKDVGTYLMLSSGETSIPEGFVKVPVEDLYHGLPGLLFRPNSKPEIPKPVTISNMETRVTNFSKLPWIPLPLKFNSRTTPSLDTIDLGFTSGHSLYRLQFPTPNSKSPIAIKIDVRHRALVYFNDELLGGHTTYSHLMFRPGVKNGPDPFPGWTSYSLPSELLSKSRHVLNSIVIIVESWGFSRMAYWLNDARNPRGLLAVKCSSSEVTDSLKWETSGVDVRTLSNPFSVTGFPDEFELKNWSATEPQVSAGTIVFKSRNGLPTWYRAKISVVRKAGVRVPLRVQMTGPGDAQIFISEIYIGRFYGNGDTPQRDFNIPEGLLGKWDEEKVFELDVKLLVYGVSKEHWVGIEIKP
ncbi:hypothetical protein HK096_005874, partial [Nowakowskiella sp. JEL0078]